jgi:DNA-binding protein HU-beta
MRKTRSNQSPLARDSIRLLVPERSVGTVKEKTRVCLRVFAEKNYIGSNFPALFPCAVRVSAYNGVYKGFQSLSALFSFQSRFSRLPPRRRKTKMTKAELVARMAQTSGLGRPVAEKALNGFITAVSDALAQSQKVTLVGFGTFDVAQRAQREGRNPRTGQPITIPLTKAVRFKAGNRLKETVQ